MSFNALRRGRYSESGREYLVTSVVTDRRPVFANFHIARLLVSELRQIEVEEMGVWLAWVVMPDHFHGLLSLGESNDLSALMKVLKGRSARTINAYSGQNGAFWMPAFHDRALRKEDDRINAARYLISNPVRAGLVESVGDWPHWDSVYL
jgi:putative transposase